MKSTGIVRKIDNLGRIVLPKGIRDTYGLEYETPVEIYTDGDHIILKKYQVRCLFCGGENNLHSVGSWLICPACARMHLDAVQEAAHDVTEP